MFRILDGNLDDMICALVDLQNKADDLASYIEECFETEVDGDDDAINRMFMEIDLLLDKAKEHYNNFVKENENA